MTNYSIPVQYKIKTSFENELFETKEDFLNEDIKNMNQLADYIDNVQITQIGEKFCITNVSREMLETLITACEYGCASEEDYWDHAYPFIEAAAAKVYKFEKE